MVDNRTKQTPQRELERFFAEAAPRLDTAATLDAELDRQLARRFNVFRYLRADEVGFSRMIADLLDPNGDHGQGTLFLQLLTDKLEFARGANLGHAEVKTERKIDGRSLDISVEIGREHCLAIESKSNFAGDGESQVEDYLKSLKRYGNSCSFTFPPLAPGLRKRAWGRKPSRNLRRRRPETSPSCHATRRGCRQTMSSTNCVCRSPSSTGWRTAGGTATSTGYVGTCEKWKHTVGNNMEGIR